MDIRIELVQKTKQVLSQTQIQSLNILSMSAAEIREFLQREEIENPLIEYSENIREHEITVKYQEHDRFFGRIRPEENERAAYESGYEQDSLEEVIFSQLDRIQLGKRKKKIVEFCVHSLDGNGYLTIPAGEIADILEEDEGLVNSVLDKLKELEPKGIFASGLEECLILQIRDADQERLLETVIRNHLQDISEGRISVISRTMGITSAEVRLLIQKIKSLNPRPLNGFGEEHVQYILPDIIVEFKDDQWMVGLNDQWTGSLGINDFYVRMMESAMDEELKRYFEEKLQRARFVIEAIEQRRKTLIGIAEEIIRLQEGYFLGREPLRKMTMEEVADRLGIHKSTVSRAIRDKYMLTPIGCVVIRELFTAGIAAKDGDISRNEVKKLLKQLIDREDKSNPYSDEQLLGLLRESGMTISRRTVAKYRAEMGIAGVFQRRTE